MEREILAYIKQNRMIGKNDVVLAGVSGGIQLTDRLRFISSSRTAVILMNQLSRA